MKAHKVKCQICASGVIVVAYQQAGADAPNLMLVSATLTDDEALALVCRHLAILRNEEAVQAGFDVAFTPEDIYATHEWVIQRTNILSHL